MEAGKFIKMKINVLQATHFTAATWQQVMQKTTVNCFCLCSYGHDVKTEAGSHSSINYYYYYHHHHHHHHHLLYAGYSHLYTGKKPCF
jgi:hypothetical protein